MRSLFSGVSGLRNHQTAMDVIGNNIANVNTAGYKSARVVFSDIFSQNVSSSASASATTGGINANQIGLGMQVSTIDTIFSLSGYEATGSALDVMINGDGFFAVITGNGDGETPTLDTAASVSYTRAGNFYFDSAGYLVTADGRYVLCKRADDIFETWSQPELVEDTEVDSDTGEVTQPDADQLGALRLDPQKYRDVSINEKGEVTALYREDEDSEETRVVVAYIPIVTFTNQQGLEKDGGNYYSVSPNSGGPIYRNAGDQAPTLKPAGLEMSNVDLAQEFTKMITTQRGYQANSRIITVSDTLLEELVNLKR